MPCHGQRKEYIRGKPVTALCDQSSEQAMGKNGVVIKKKPTGFFYKEKFSAFELVSNLLTSLKLYIT